MFNAVAQPLLLTIHAERDENGGSLVQYQHGDGSAAFDVDAVVHRKKLKHVGDAQEARVETIETMVRIPAAQVEDPAPNYDLVHIKETPTGPPRAHLVVDIVARSDIEWVMEIQ